MARILFFLALLIGSVWLGLHLQDSPGYVLVRYGEWSVGVTLWFAIVSVIATFLLFYFLFRFVGFTRSMPQKMRKWGASSSLKKSEALTHKSLIALACGEWQRAERMASSAIKEGGDTLVNYLCIARAAQKQGDDAKRDQSFANACEKNPEAHIALDMERAAMQLECKQFEQALAALRHLYQRVPNNKHVLTLLKNVYIALSDWVHLQRLLPALKKQKVLENEDYVLLEEFVYLSLLDDAAVEDSDVTAHDVWEALPASLRSDEHMVAAYALALVAKDDHAGAEKIVRGALKYALAPELLDIYSELTVEEAHQQVSHAEVWLKKNPDEPDLLLCLGVLSSKAKMWGKARDYLMRCIALEKNALAYRALGHVYEQLGERDKAYDAFRSAAL